LQVLDGKFARRLQESGRAVKPLKINAETHDLSCEFGILFLGDVVFRTEISKSVTNIVTFLFVLIVYLLLPSIPFMLVEYLLNFLDKPTHVTPRNELITIGGRLPPGDLLITRCFLVGRLFAFLLALLPLRVSVPAARSSGRL
jgi:hypothetical protein